MQNALRTSVLFLLCIGLCLCLGITAFADGEQVIIPSGVTRLEAEAFANCEAMTDVVIPERVTVIGDGCFSGCTNLANIFYSGTQD